MNSMQDMIKQLTEEIVNLSKIADLRIHQKVRKETVITVVLVIICLETANSHLEKICSKTSNSEISINQNDTVHQGLFKGETSKQNQMFQ